MISCDVITTYPLLICISTAHASMQPTYKCNVQLIFLIYRYICCLLFIIYMYLHTVIQSSPYPHVYMQNAMPCIQVFYAAVIKNLVYSDCVRLPFKIAVQFMCAQNATKRIRIVTYVCTLTHKIGYNDIKYTQHRA